MTTQVNAANYAQPAKVVKGNKNASGSQKTSQKKSVFTEKEKKAKAEQEKAQAEKEECKALGLINNKGAGTKVKSKNGETYTVVGNAANGRKIVKDANGQIQVLAADGTLLKKSYVKESVAKEREKAQAQNDEYKSLGLINNNGAGTKVKSKNGETYTVVGTATNGRKIVKDANGQTQVLAADGTLLKKDIVIRDVKAKLVRTDSKAAQEAVLDAMKTQLNSAQKAFQNQMDKDGWAADVADGISNLWGVFQKDGNQAWRVRQDLQEYTENMQQLSKAAKQGDAAFNAKFKQLYGKDFDQKAMADYVKNPNEENYKKAFGTKNDIKTRVDKYNSSQDTGAEAVKTTAKIAAGAAIGMATGGTGLAALGTAALATGVTSVVVEETDRMDITDAVTKGEVNFREGTDHKKILTGAAFDSVSVLAGGVVGKAAIGVTKGAATLGAKAARLAINTAGDVAVGAAQEYVETGEVTAGGVISNAAVSAVGGAVVDGTLNMLGKGIKSVKNKLSGVDADIDLPAGVHTSSDVDISAPKTNTDVDVPAGTRTDADVSTPKPDTDISTAHSVNDGASPAGQTKPDIEADAATGKKKAYVKPETKEADLSPKQDLMADTRDVSTPKTTPDTGTSPSHSINEGAATVKKGFMNEIMSNTKAAEAGLKSCDLSNPEVRQTYIDALSAEFPDFARYPRKQKLLNQMQQLLNHPDYANLSDVNKTMAKISILKDNGIDPSELYKKCKIPVSVKRRIGDVEYCLQNQVDSKSAAILYHDGDFATFKVLNDIKNPNAANISSMREAAARAADNGGYLLQQSHITNTKNIPVKGVSVNGTTYNVKVLDLSDDNVLGNLSHYGFEEGTTSDNLKLTVHMNDDINRAPQMTVRRMMGSNDLNLSATLTDGTNHLYGDMQVGVLLDYDQGAVSYASNYAAGTGFVKGKSSFAADKLKESASSADSFIKDRFLANLKSNGIEMGDEDYAAFSNMMKGKKMTSAQLQNMSENGLITINGKKYNTKQIQDALSQSSADMLNMQAEINGKKFKKGFNEINVYNPEIKALYIRANNPDEKLEDILSEKLLKFAQDNNLPIVFQRSNFE